MNVTFAAYGEQLASSRLRALIPQAELAKLGIGKGREILVYGKHWLTEEEIKPFGKRVFDVCDDHFAGKYGDYYRTHIERADSVTCNSRVMQDIILEQTGRMATVIPEPYEGPERTPSIGDTIFWFGHSTNYQDFLDAGLNRPVVCMSNHHDCLPWSPENFDLVMNDDLIVVIPTGKRHAKSENRMVESIRAGKYVCAGPLRAYEPFYDFYPCMDINEHIERALADPDASLKAIGRAQDYIRERYSPETIGQRWKQVLEGLSNGRTAD